MHKVFVAGARGLVGSAITRALQNRGGAIALTPDRHELDLLDQRAVLAWFQREQPEQVYLVAGTVGGIEANRSRPAEFIYDNLMIHCNVINAARETNVKKLLYLGSSCIYPRESAQPITEDALLTGRLEPTNEWYAVAKIAGIKMCQAYRLQYGCDFIAAMPTNLYGPFDNFDLNSSHVLPALLRKFHDAKDGALDSVEIWGSGTPKREFLFVDDLAAACLFLMEHYSSPEIVNIGTGVDVSIADLANLVRDVVAKDVNIHFDPSKPDGTPRKVLDVSRIKDLGWQATTSLEDGIRLTYDWFLNAIASGQVVRGYEP